MLLRPSLFQITKMRGSSIAEELAALVEEAEKMPVECLNKASEVIQQSKI